MSLSTALHLILVSINIHHGRHKLMAQVVRFFSLKWENQTEFPAPGHLGVNQKIESGECNQCMGKWECRRVDTGVSVWACGYVCMGVFNLKE